MKFNHFSDLRSSILLILRKKAYIGIAIFLLSLLTTKAMATVLFDDDFNDGNYDGWEVAHGAWSVENGELSGIGAGGGIDGWIYAGDPGWTDYILQTKIIFETGNAELIFRSTGNWQDEYRISFWWENSPAYTNCFGLSKWQNGVGESIVGNTPSPVPITNPAYVKVEGVGPTIRLFVNDYLIYEYEDPDPLPNGRVGLGVVWSWQCNFDDVLVNDGLVAYYPFNGNANDESGSGNNGTVHGPILTEDTFGNPNSAYSFDGVDDYIQVLHNDNLNINPTTGFTVAGWFKANTTQPEYLVDLIDKSHGHIDHTGWAIQGGSWGIHLVVGDGGVGWFEVGFYNTILDNQWHHFASTFVGTNMEFYFDGVLEGTNTFFGTPGSNNRDLFMGKHYALGRHFEGVLDNIRVYNRALSEIEIQEFYNEERPPHPVLVVNVWGSSYNEDGYHVYQTVANAGADATFVHLSSDGQVAALLQANTYDQIWIFDLSTGADNYPSDWQAIADWYNARPNCDIICDARIISSYWNGRWTGEGQLLSENYYQNLYSNPNGGLVLGTDHINFQGGINTINSLIGIDLFSGTYYLTQIPVDTSNPLMNTPNNMGDHLWDDSSPGQTPYGLQSNGLILYTVAWHSNNPDTPGISSTIEGVIGFHVDITSPENGATFGFGDTITFSAEPINGQPPFTYAWSSSIDGQLDTGQTIEISSLSVGTHMITVLAEDGEDRDDDDSITIDVILVPDLEITNLDIPSQGLTGQPFEVEWTVTNTDAAVAEGPWLDNVYISPDPEYDNGNDTFLGSAEYPSGSSLNPTESYTRIRAYSLPVTPGDYWIIVVTDVNDDIEELGGEDNNIYIADLFLVVEQMPMPDLVVSQVVPPPDGVLSGTTTEITFSLKNQGTGATEVTSWLDSVFIAIDSDLTWDGSWTTVPSCNVEFGSVEFGNPRYLESNEEYTQTVSITLLEDRTGVYYVYVIADNGGCHDDGVVPELDNSNNLLRSINPFIIDLAPQPDLQVLANEIIFNDIAFSGQDFTVSWTDRNEGEGPTDNDQWIDAVYLSENTNPTINLGVDTLFGTKGRSGSVLNPGEFDNSLILTNRLSDDLSGQYYIKIFVDSNDNISESGFEFNNVGVSTQQVDVILSPAIDLVPTDISAIPLYGSNFVPGHRFNVTWSAENMGAPPQHEESWQDAIYLSDDNVFDSLIDDQLGSFPHGTSQNSSGDPTLPPYTKTRTVRLPNDTIEGPHYLFMVVDANNNVYEGECSLQCEHNNIRVSDPILVEFVPTDLVIEINFDDDHLLPDSASANQPITVSWKVTNVGQCVTPVSFWSDRVLFSTDTLPGGDDTLTQAGHFPELYPGASYIVERTVTVPPVTTGDYYLLFLVDYTNSVYEQTSGEDNNMAFHPFTVTPEASDLVVTSIDAPENATANQPVHIEWTVQNQGSMITNTSTWIDRVYLSKQKRITRNANELGSRTRGQSLAPGESYTLSGDFQIPDDYSGLYQIIVETDSNNQVFETSENNNSMAHPVLLDIEGVEVLHANLIVDYVDAPETMTSGQTLSLTWQVSNIGEGPTNTGNWYDGAYLSRDQFLDKDSDIYLGSYHRTDFLDIDESYTMTHGFNVPFGISGPYFVFILTDRSNNVNEDGREDDNENYDPEMIDIVIPPPSDLEVGNITLPTSGVLGENSSFNWEITNAGEQPINGSWKDSVYLSVDATWDLDDKRAGTFTKPAGILNPGESIIVNGTDRIPAVIPGEYCVIVRTDVFNQIPEIDETNNLGISGETFNVTAIPLSLEEFYLGELSTGQEKYFELFTPPGETVRITLDHDSTVAWTELYVKYGLPPTPGDFDFIYNLPAQPDQEILIPTTEIGMYYILVRALTGAGNSHPSQFSLLAEILPFSINSVEPEVVGAGEVTIRFTGSKWGADTTFFIRNTDTLEIIEPFETFIVDATYAAAIFDLTYAGLGGYDVVAVDSNSRSNHELLEGLTIEIAAPPSIFLEISGMDAVRPGTYQIYQIYYGNIGNVDAVGVPLWIGGIPQEATLHPLFECIPPPWVGEGEDPTDWEEVPIDFEIEETGEKVIPLLIPRLVPGHTSLLQIRITIPSTVQQFELTAWVARPFFQSPLSDRVINCIVNVVTMVAKISPGVGCIVTILWDVIRPLMGTLWGDNTYSLKQIIAQFLLNCGGEISGGLLEILELVNKINKIIAAPQVIVDCIYAFRELFDRIKFRVTVLLSIDPNEKVGPAGFSIEQWIGSKDGLPYKIYFENVSEATTAAARVEITDILDPSLNNASFRLGDINFGETTIDVPDNRVSYQTTVDLTDSYGVLVDITAGVNAANNEAFWIFQSIDPTTGEPPTDPLLGFLPPNDETGSGQGWVDFTIRPWPDIATGTVINNDAIIVFDQNEPIDTNEVFNTIDGDPPISEMDPLPDMVEETNIELTWWGEDQESGSGIGGYTIYMRLDGSLYVPVIFASSEETFGTYEGARGGGTYEFYSLASDNAGNMEDPPEFPDAVTTVVIQMPFEPDLNTSTAATVMINTLETANMGYVEHVVLEEISGLYVGANGRLIREPFWQPLNQWDNFQVRALSARTDFSFKAKARSESYEETEFGPASFIMTSSLGDVNGDDSVNGIDINLVLGALGTSYDKPGFDARADLDADDRITSKDLDIVHQNMDGPMFNPSFGKGIDGQFSR